MVGQFGIVVGETVKILGVVFIASDIFILRKLDGPFVPSQLIAVAITFKLPQKPTFQLITPVAEFIVPGFDIAPSPPPGMILSMDHSIDA